MRHHLRVIFIVLIVCVLVFERCAYNDIPPVNCDNSTLRVVLASKSDASDCRAINGVITVTASGGKGSYAYNIDGGEYQSGSTFHDLGAGTHEIRVKDGNMCWRAVNVTIGTAGSTFAAAVETQADNQCTSDNGIAAVTPSGGVPPYQYQIDSKGFSSVSTFTGLKEGQHVIVVKDASECQTTISFDIEHGLTGISYASQIKNIITTNCALSGCHGAGTGSRDWTIFNNVKTNALNIKIRTANHTMPPDNQLGQSDIDLIGCWVDDGALEN